MRPQLQDLYDDAQRRPGAPRLPFDPAQCMAPLPRAYQWADGSAYINHVELVRKARNAEVPESFYTDPLMYQGGSDDFIGPCDPIVVAERGLRHRLRGRGRRRHRRRARWAPRPTQALDGIRLVMLANDVSLRNLIPAELAKGFGFFQSKPATAFSPVAVTLDELGDAWQGGRVHLDAAEHLERPQGRHVRCRRGDDLPLRPADRAHRQDAQRARRQHRRQRHGEQQGLAARLLLHRREALHRDHPGRRSRRPSS